MSKEYWCVRSKIYDDGSVETAMSCAELEEKPQNKYRYCEYYDWYEDWFDTYAEVADYVDDCRHA